MSELPTKSLVEFEQEALTVRSEMTAIKIVDQPSYDLAVDARVKATEFLKNAGAFFDGPISDAHNLHKKLLQQKKSVCDPVDATIKAINRELVAWDTEQERLRVAEQRRLEEAARKEAEAQKLADAEHLVEQGMSQDEALEAAVSEPVAVAAPVVERTYQKSSAVTYAETWSGECFDMKKVIAAAAKGNATALSVLQINSTALNGLARSMKEMLAEAVPGCRAVSSKGVRTGRA